MENLPNKLKYYHSFTDYLYWSIVALVPLVTAAIAICKYSLMWFVVYVVLLVTLVAVIMKFYCSHCPHYINGKRVIQCMFFWGVPKFFQERPGSLALHERIITLIAALIIMLLPLYWLIQLPAFLAIYVLSLMVLTMTIRRYECSRCIYVDCPLNNVADSVSDITTERDE